MDLSFGPFRKGRAAKKSIPSECKQFNSPTGVVAHFFGDTNHFFCFLQNRLKKDPSFRRRPSGGCRVAEHAPLSDFCSQIHYPYPFFRSLCGGEGFCLLFRHTVLCALSGSSSLIYIGNVGEKLNGKVSPTASGDADGGGPFCPVCGLPRIANLYRGVHRRIAGYW